MEIRKALIHELPDILAMQKRAFYDEAVLYNDFTISPLNQKLEELEEEFTQKLILVAIIDNSLVGSVRIQVKDGIGYIGKLIVAPEKQNKGIGRKLMEEAEKHCTTVSEIQLFTGEKSEKNIHLYQSLGYQIVDVIPETQKVTLVIMKKKTEN
jgi:ribosomal protein S18 acetylase RimI-like enzyme